MVVITNFAAPTEGIKHVQSNTTAIINNRELGKGTLFVAESRLAWVHSSITTGGFALEYPHIAIHAVSRDLQSYPQECVYLALDTCIDNEEDKENNDSDEESNNVNTEIRFVPDDKSVLDDIFLALSQCQALHPDPEDSFSEDDVYEDAGEEEEYQSGNEDINVGVRRANGHQSDMEIDGQFEDADFIPED